MLRGLVFFSFCLSVCMSVRMYMCMSVLSGFFAHKLLTDGWIMMILAYIIDIGETLKLTQS